MEEGTFHVHVMYFLSFGSNNIQDQPDGVHSRYWSECLIVVQALNLRVSFFHQLSLVLGCGSINKYIGFVNLFALNQLPSWG